MILDYNNPDQRQTLISALRSETIAFSKPRDVLHSLMVSVARAIETLQGNEKRLNSAKDTNVLNKWIVVENDGVPQTYYKSTPTQESFLVVVAERWNPKDEWEYHVDVALNWGTYIDDFWDTQNDWHEGQEVHIVAYIPFPDPLRIPPKGGVE